MNMHYVALLRGINVGGNKKVEMKQLKALFETLGFTEVATLLNSGNVWFSSPEIAIGDLQDTLQKVLASHFHFEIQVVIKTLDQIRSICQAIPDHFQNDSQMKTDVLFLYPAFDFPEVVEQLPLRSGIDTVIYTPGAVIWKVDRDQHAKSGMAEFIKTKVYRHMTARNVNTTRKLARN